MIYLHAIVPPIIHRDLKSLNLLLDSPLLTSIDERINLKIADFGLAKSESSSF